ncbi:hypothetical protein M899_2326 [Bacteriovorax sp. BSW11_IV]|uniref:hypothetical protein n=1 Tax=Bacteriovorax sp. BSW11_IV TaxID=1353529 RepID=UPI00038A52CD|nr:hypothetical protein [Bacteriovorax sp. BSW11_IV]EQC44490.1 hypothetical protein M899_2326 [Bacteriovorax sp. BSW11_IV]
MKYLMAIVLLLSAMGANANECYMKFVDDGNHDSRSFQINDIDLNNDFDEDAMSFSKEAIVQVAKSIGCKAHDLGLANKNAMGESCVEMIPGKPFSKVCYVESDVGYFMVSKDMLDHVNIIYNRWD